MSRRSKELASALVRCQGRVRVAEKALAALVAAGKNGNPKDARRHRELRDEVTRATNDVAVLERMLRDELARPFDLLAAKMGAH